METQLVRRPDGPQAWEDHEALIVDLYITRGLELGEVMNIMEKEHFFKATEKQYKSHFTEWGIRKNVKSKEWNAILRKKRKREQEGKESAFRLGGTPVDSSRIAREEKRRKLGDQSRLAEAVTPPDLICSTPSPVAYSPVARSPIFSPLQLSEPWSIAILSSIKRVLYALISGALYPDKWPDTALDRDNIIESFLGLLIDMVGPLLYEERGILIDVIQTTVLMSNGCFLCWVKLVFELLEASRAKNKPSKRDNGNRFYQCLARLTNKHWVEGPYGKLCGSGLPFVVTMDSFKQLLRIIDTHSVSGQTLRINWMFSPCIALIHKPVDSDQYGADSLLFERLSRVLERWADLDNPQTGADSDYRPEGSLLSHLSENCHYSMLYLVSLLLGTVKLIKKLSEQKRMDAHDGIGSPTPPSPGSDRSQISFLSDSVVDWKELARGLSPYNSTQGNEEAWIDDLEALE